MNAVGQGKVDNEAGPAPQEDGVVVRECGRRAVLVADMVGSTALRKTSGDAALTWIRRHNVLVARAVRDGDADEGAAILKYNSDSVVVSFDTVQAALRCARSITDLLAGWSSQKGSKQILSRMGISVGDIAQVHYLEDESVFDWHGRPIDIASRLVADVAKPGQILVDDDAALESDPGKLDACLRPNPDGENLPIESEAQVVKVYELVDAAATVDGERLRNRPRLIRELTELSPVARDLQLAVEGMTRSGHRAAEEGGGENVRMAEVEALTIDYRLVRLDTKWKDLTESCKDDEVSAGYDDVGACWVVVQKRWDEHEDAFRSSGDAERKEAARPYLVALNAFSKAVRYLCKRIESTVEALWTQP